MEIGNGNYEIIGICKWNPELEYIIGIQNSELRRIINNRIIVFVFPNCTQNLELIFIIEVRN